MDDFLGSPKYYFKKTSILALGLSPIFIIAGIVLIMAGWSDNYTYYIKHTDEKFQIFNNPGTTFNLLGTIILILGLFLLSIGFIVHYKSRKKHVTDIITILTPYAKYSTEITTLLNLKSNKLISNTELIKRYYTLYPHIQTTIQKNSKEVRIKELSVLKTNGIISNNEFNENYNKIINK